jgi:RNA polymerase sigma factor (sigma-70 family)
VKIAPAVMNPEDSRSTDMTAALTAAAPPATTSATALDFDALYRASRDDVYAYVATLVRDAAAAEDVTALAFERAFRKRRSWSPRRGSGRAWLFGIARNAALDELRRGKRSAALVAEPADLAGAVAEEDEEARARREALRAGLAALTPRERELVALKFHAGLSHAELGRVLGVSESNAGTQLHRTVQKLREACDVAP